MSLAVLAACTVCIYWKITLTSQFTWLDSPDLAYQVLPWMQESARQWQSGHFPLWDPHHWGGYPLVGQSQPGILFPLNWLLWSTPMLDGHLKLTWVNWYYALIHYFGCVFCYALCRDRSLSPTASVAAGVTFGLGGFVGNTAWPQMINGA
ncbi:MAG: hypothetical protein H7039_12050, partial [Bryobacteraceae bacterium]|nr:hypothetical protein [Bryobacteraceae bacterium]